MNRTVAPLTLLTLVLVACPGSQQTPVPPDSAFYDAAPAFGASVPASVSLLSPSDFETWFKVNGASWFTQDDITAQQGRDRAADAQSEAAVQALVARHPEDAGELLPGPDGDVPTTVPTAGGPQTVLTLGRNLRLNLIAGGLARFPTASNQLRLYTLTYGDIKTFLGTQNINISQFGLPDPAAPDTQALGSAQLLALNDRVASLASQFQGKLAQSVIHFDPAAAEVGAGDQLDRSQSGACKPPADQGIYKNLDWPLKKLTTSIKTQGTKRGTCWAFADVAALEIGIAKQDHKLVNLSEQDFIGHRMLDLRPRATDEGGDGGDIAQGAYEKNYEFAFENAYQYNQSPSRQNVSNPVISYLQYSHSCDGYAAVCSDTNYQGYLYCTQVQVFSRPSATVCARAMPTLASRSGYHVGQPPSDFWDFDNINRSLVILLLRSALGNPTVISIDDRYLTPDANGYVPDRDPMQKIDDTGKSVDDIQAGRHVVTITGFVSNEQLAQAVPGAPQADGVGYFIVKNSWGDVGYAYRPYEWARKYIGEAFSGIQP